MESNAVYSSNTTTLETQQPKCYRPVLIWCFREEDGGRTYKLHAYEVTFVCDHHFCEGAFHPKKHGERHV